MEAATAQRFSPTASVPPRLRTDASLVRAAAAGDQAAFAVIFRRYQQPLYRYCYSLLGSEADAADALQNAMVATLRALPGERRKVELKPWLYRVAHNEAISLIRRRRPQEKLDEASAGTGADPAATSEARAEFRQLVADLTELSEAQRSALVLRELSGLSYEEIAKVFEISLSATKQSIHKARLALQEIAEGREMACDGVRTTLSERDGRLLKGRGIRAHLKSCSGCRDFKAAIANRQVTLNAAIPLLTAPAAAQMLASALGCGWQGGGGLGAVLGSGKLAGSSAAVKAIAVGAATVGIGVGGAGLTGALDAERGKESGVQPAQRADYRETARENPLAFRQHTRTVESRRSDKARSRRSNHERAARVGGEQAQPDAPPAPPAPAAPHAGSPPAAFADGGVDPPGSTQTGVEQSSGAGEQTPQGPTPTPIGTAVPPSPPVSPPSPPVSPPTPAAGASQPGAPGGSYIP